MSRKQILLRSGILFLSVYLALALLFYYRVAGSFKTLLIKQRQREISALLDSTKSTVTLKSFEQPEAVPPVFSQALKTRASVRRIAVLDSKGRILSCTNREFTGQAEQTPDALALLRYGRSGFFLKSDDPGRLFLIYTYTFEGRTAGGVELVFNIDDINEAVKGAVLFTLLAVLAAFAFIFLLSAVRAMRTAAVHRDLLHGFKALSAGNSNFEPQSSLSGEAEVLFQEFRSARDHLRKREAVRQALFEKSKNLAVSRTFDTLFERLNDQLKVEMNIDANVVMLIKDDSLVISSVDGYDEGTVFKDEVYRIHEDVFTELLEYGKPVILDDHTEIRVNARYKTLVRGSGLVALFPITLGNEVYGLIHVSRGREKGPYKDTEIDAGFILAGGAGIAMMHLTENAEKRVIAAEEYRPEPREFKTGEQLLIRAIPLSSDEWVEFFHFPGEQKSDTTLVAVSSFDLTLRKGVRERVLGMLDMAFRLKKQMGSLSFFSLSMLMKMPASETRDKFLKQFRESPFSVEGLKTLLRDELKDDASKVRIEVFKLDTRKQSFDFHYEGLDLFRIEGNSVEKQDKLRGAFEDSDVLIMAPKGLLTEASLRPIARETDLSRMLQAVQTKYSEAVKGNSKPQGFAAALAARFNELP